MMIARDVLARFVRRWAPGLLYARRRWQRAKTLRLARRIVALPPDVFPLEAVTNLCDRFAPLVRYMAATGSGTDACLAADCLPMMVHFYSPVPDIADLKRRAVWTRRNITAGIDMRLAAQLALLRQLGEQFAGECIWAHEDTGDTSTFFTDNSTFSYGCAAALHSAVRHFKPRRVIEIGSGNSSRVISAATRMNFGENGLATDYTVIDPYPAPALRELAGLTRLRAERAELVELATFDELEKK